MHQSMGAQRQIDTVLNLQIFRISKILQMEETLHLLHAFFCQVHCLFFFICDIITCLIAVFFHDDIHLRQLFFGSFFQLTHQIVTRFINFRGLAAGTRYDKRRPRLVDQYRIHLIHDGIVELPLYQLFLVNHHIITEIIKSQFVIRRIGNITVVCLAPCIVIHTVEDHPDTQAKKFMDLSHPLRITLRQIVINRHDMDAFPLQCIQIRRKCGDQRLTFTSTHLRDTPLMQDHAADELHSEMAQTDRSFGRLPDNGICLRQYIIQCLPFLQSLFKFRCLCLQLII